MSNLYRWPVTITWSLNVDEKMLGGQIVPRDRYNNSFKYVYYSDNAICTYSLSHTEGGNN